MNTRDQELNQQLIQNPNQETVQLEQPIQFGDNTITEITIRKPNVKALSGIGCHPGSNTCLNCVAESIRLVLAHLDTGRDLNDLIEEAALAEANAVSVHEFD